MRRVWFLLVGVGLLVFLVVHLGTDEIFDMLAAVGWGFVGIVLMHLAHQCSRATALWLSVPSARAVSYVDALLIRLSGEAVRFLTFTGPFLAEPTKAWLFKVRGLTVVEGFAATATEYAAYTLLSAMMAITAVSYLLHRSDIGPEVAALSLFIPIAFVAGAVAGFAALVRGRHPMARSAQWLAGRPILRRRWQPNLDAIRDVECRLQTAARERPAALIGILSVQVIAQALLVGEAYWILRSLDLAPAWQAPLIIEGGAKMNAAFFVIPGQVGAAEAMYAVLFGTLGLSSAAGFTMAFVRRLRTLLVAALGLAALAVLLRASVTKGAGPAHLGDVASALANGTRAPMSPVDPSRSPTLVEHTRTARTGSGEPRPLP